MFEWSPKRLENPPVPSEGQMMVTTVLIGGSVYLFGGSWGSPVLEGLWTLDYTRNEWNCIMPTFRNEFTVALSGVTVKAYVVNDTLYALVCDGVPVVFSYDLALNELEETTTFGVIPVYENKYSFDYLECNNECINISSNNVYGIVHVLDMTSLTWSKPEQSGTLPLIGVKEQTNKQSCCSYDKLFLCVHFPNHFGTVLYMLHAIHNHYNWSELDYGSLVPLDGTAYSSMVYGDGRLLLLGGGKEENRHVFDLRDSKLHELRDIDRETSNSALIALGNDLLSVKGCTPTNIPRKGVLLLAGSNSLSSSYTLKPATQKSKHFFANREQPAASIN